MLLMRCDKCGQEVEKNNSALELEQIIHNDFFWNVDRHLFPVGNCPGSPSRVKRISDGDPIYTAAYAQLKKIVPSNGAACEQTNAG